MKARPVVGNTKNSTLGGAGVSASTALLGVGVGPKNKSYSCEWKIRNSAVSINGAIFPGLICDGRDGIARFMFRCPNSGARFRPGTGTGIMNLENLDEDLESLPVLPSKQFNTELFVQPLTPRSLEACVLSGVLPEQLLRRYFMAQSVRKYYRMLVLVSVVEKFRFFANMRPEHSCSAFLIY